MYSWLVLSSLLFSGMVMAQQPNAGSLQQQLPSNEVNADKEIALPDTAIDGQNNLPKDVRFVVNGFRFAGNTVFSEPTLLALIDDAVGSEQSLYDIGQLASRLTHYYRQQGYPLSRAIIPQQEIVDGIVQLAIIEATIGETHLVNDSAVKDALLEATIAPLASGELVREAELYTSLLLLSDIPSTIVRSSLSPGDDVGSTDVVYHVTEVKPLSASLMLDQYGDQYTGRERLSTSFNANNLLGYGDAFSFNSMHTQDLNFARLGYDWIINGKGMHLGAAYSGLNYALGQDMSSLQAYGTTRVASVWFKQPLVRSLTNNVYSQLHFEQNKLRDFVDSEDLKTHRTLTNLEWSVSGDTEGRLSDRGKTQWQVKSVFGEVEFDDADAATTDLESAHTAGDFIKVNVTAAHQRPLTDNISVSVNVAGQWANGNLDSSQKMGIGGIGSVRAYKSGSISGDSGYSFNVQLNYQLGHWLDGATSLSMFYDYAKVKVNTDVWDGLEGVNDGALDGAGIGLVWSNDQQLMVNLQVATPGSNTSTLAPITSRVRSWLQVSQQF